MGLDSTHLNPHRMETLLNGLLAYSQVGRTPNSSPKSVDVGEVLESVTEKETGAEISTSILRVVQGEPVPLVLLFQNLVSNALKYWGKGRPCVKNIVTRAPNHWFFCRGRRLNWDTERVSNPDLWDFQASSQPRGIFRRRNRSWDMPEDCRAQRRADLGGIRAVAGSTFFFTLPYAAKEI